MPVSIEDQLGIGSEPRELIIGKSFHKLLASSSSSATSSNSKKGRNGHGSASSASTGDSFHTLRYDFKPASVDVSKMARMEFSQNNDKVKVTVPNVEASNQPETIFTGNKKPHLKECVLIIDHETGEITLERLTHSINVKKTRVEGSSKSQQHLRPSTPSSFSPSCSSGQNVSKPSNVQSKPPPPPSPSKDQQPSSSPNGHLAVPGQINGKPAKSVLAPSPRSQPNSSQNFSDVAAAVAKSSSDDESDSSSSEGKSGSSSSSSSDSGSSSDEDDVIRRDAEDVIRRVGWEAGDHQQAKLMNGSSALPPPTHNKYSGDYNSSDDDEDDARKSRETAKRSNDRKSRQIDCSATSSRSTPRKSSQDTKTRQETQSTSALSSAGFSSNSNLPTAANKESKIPLSMPKLSQLSSDLQLSEESGSDSD